jgi:hypothetical protein
MRAKLKLSKRDGDENVLEAYRPRRFPAMLQIYRAQHLCSLKLAAGPRGMTTEAKVALRAG